MDYTSETRTFESILSTTLDAYRGTLQDNVFKSHPLWARLKTKGMVKRQDGGVSIIVPVALGKNSTIAWYSGYDIINLTPQDPFTVAKYGWTQCGGSISIDRKTIRRNSGRSQLINLVSALIQNAEDSMVEVFSEDIYEAGAYNEAQTSKQMAGFTAMISEDPDSYDVGGIDTDVNTDWRNKVEGNGGANFSWVPDLGDTPAAADGPIAMAKLYNNISKGPGGSPDIGICGQYMYQQYESGLHPFKRFGGDATTATAGFENLRFRNMDLFWDEFIKSANVTASAAATSQELAFFITSKFMELMVDSQTDMILSDWLQPETQDAKTKHLLWMGNFLVTRRKKHGVLTYASVTDRT